MEKCTAKENGLFFNLVIFLVLGFIGGICIANAVYFNKIKNEKNDSLVSLSTSGATFLAAINVVFGIISIIMAIWYLIKVIFDQASRKKAFDMITEKTLTAYRKYDESGGLYNIGRTSPWKSSNGMNNRMQKPATIEMIDMSDD